MLGFEFLQSGGRFKVLSDLAWKSSALFQQPTLMKDLLRARAIETILNAFEAQDVGSLRLALSRDLDPYRRYLQDDGLPVFVERAVRQDASYKIWLDGVAGHLVGKRAANWTNRTIHLFELEVRIVGANLTRWLSLAQTAQGNGAALRSIHVVENRWARPHDRPEPSPG